jgi:hypothetical protein
VLGWLWRLICWAFGETGRKAAFYCRFLFVPSLLPLFPFFLSPSPLMVYSAALLALWLWLDLCGSGGAGCLLGGLVSAAAVVLALALLAFRFWA